MHWYILLTYARSVIDDVCYKPECLKGLNGVDLPPSGQRCATCYVPTASSSSQVSVGYPWQSPSSLAFGSDQVMPRALYPSSCPLLACSGTDRDRPCSTATPQALVRIEHAPAPSLSSRPLCLFPAPRVIISADDEGVQCC